MKQSREMLESFMRVFERKQKPLAIDWKWVSIESTHIQRKQT
jgi:hypothetical protein